jgi:exonuclease SbcC
MIAKRLELTNFLSYRQTAVVDFNGIHLACISGANGAGKSSILDGMTWALFGRSRSRSDDDVVNRLALITQAPAEVRFEFELEGMCYRIIRRKRHAHSTELELQFQVGDGKWETLTENRLRETQAAITDLLRMNYDTFVNASFLLQGRADEFMTKTPGKRKEILAELLGVSEWDQWRDRAAAWRKQKESELILLDGRLAEIERELQEEDERQRALAEAQMEFDAVSAQLDSMETLLGNMRRIAEAVAQQEKTARGVRQMLDRQTASLARLEKSRAERLQERDLLAAILQEAPAIEAAQKEYEAAAARWQFWQDKAAQLNILQQARRPHELSIERIRSGLEQQEKTLRQRAGVIDQMEHERASLVEQKGAMGGQLSELARQLAELAEQEQLWHDARAALQALEGERELRQKELARLRMEAARVAGLQLEQTAVVKNLEQAIVAGDDVSAKLAALSEQRQQHAAGLAERDNLRRELPRLREEMDQLKERIDRLEVETGGQCPLCGQELSETHRRQVLADMHQEGTAKGDRYRAGQSRVGALEKEIEALVQALKQAGWLEKELQTQQQRRAAAQARLDEITRQTDAWEESGPQQVALLESVLADERELKEKQEAVAGLQSLLQEKRSKEAAHKQAQEQLAGIEARLTEIERALVVWRERESVELERVSRRLEAGDFDAAAQKALAESDQAIAALGYEPARHREAKDELEALAVAPKVYQELKQAEAAIKPIDQGLADLAEQMVTQEREVKELERQLEDAVGQIALLGADASELPATEAAVTKLREEKLAANRKIGAAQQRLAVLDELRKQRQERQEERGRQTLLIQRLTMLEKSCGRDGVQALLIDQARPEIEDDANQLLERLTGGDMHVTIQTQRQQKTRDALAETLEILISDAAGERPYENYSGGEQFRVNFAVRLALSRLVARRAGAKLQTLVIDEGFGSQDPLGRQRLVEAINAIQDDFARILVITHIDELRDAFPNRIEVTKGQAGSTIALY